MKVPSIMIAVCAALALAVSSGYAATARTAPELGHSAKSGVRVQTPATLSWTIRALQEQLEIVTVKNAVLVRKNKALAARIRALEALNVQPVAVPTPPLSCFRPDQASQPEKAAENSTTTIEEAGSPTGIPVTNLWDC